MYKVTWNLRGITEYLWFKVCIKAYDQLQRASIVERHPSFFMHTSSVLFPTLAGAVLVSAKSYHLFSGDTKKITFPIFQIKPNIHACCS